MDPSPSGIQGGEKVVGNSASPSQSNMDSNPSGDGSHGPAPQRTPSLSNIGNSVHRQTFAENLRNAPSSPRHRHPSFTQAAVQELLNHPLSGQRHSNSRFAGRDLGEITVDELVSPDDVKWISMDSSVEEATMVSQ